MTSLILNRLNQELADIYENDPAVDIAEVLLAPPTFNKLLIEANDHMRYASPYQQNNTFNAVGINTPWGHVDVKASRECDECGVEIIFKNSHGQRFFPLDEMVNRILLGY